MIFFHTPKKISWLLYIKETERSFRLEIMLVVFGFVCHSSRVLFNVITKVPMSTNGNVQRIKNEKIEKKITRFFNGMFSWCWRVNLPIRIPFRVRNSTYDTRLANRLEKQQQHRNDIDLLEYLFWNIFSFCLSTDDRCIAT